MCNSIEQSISRHSSDDRSRTRPTSRGRVKAIILCLALAAAMFLGSGAIGTTPAHASGGGASLPVMDNGSGGPGLP